MAGSAAPCRAPVAYKPRVCLGRRRRVRRLSDDRFHCCGVLVMESAIIPLNRVETVIGTESVVRCWFQPVRLPTTYSAESNVQCDIRTVLPLNTYRR